ncbi:hypothetical protein FRC12_014508 [Ceratobasidium sp. 428]|nr:hypothetical protein FRC12_014508 [Ceratobasidium sp. 428]
MVFAMSERNMSPSTLPIFRSYRGPSNQMPNYPIWQVLRATMAHPELFKRFQIGEKSAAPEWLVGGDVACSNPTPLVLAEFSALYPELHVASIVCIGAGHARTIQIPKSNPWRRIMPTNVLMAMKEIATDSERVAQDMAVRFQATSDVYFRFSVDQGIQDAHMSRWQSKGEVAAHTQLYLRGVDVNGQINEAAQSITVSKGALMGVDIGATMQQPAVQQTTGVKRCPAPSPAFTGCERQISQVVNCLLSRTNERRVCVVHGLGGSGKTQIALKSVERTRDNWSDIVYVDATTRESAITTLKGFAQARKIGETHEDTLRWLESSSQSWLLVIDNADDPEQRLRDFIPGGSRGSVLITTRLRRLALLGQGSGSDCSVGQMESEDAVELLLTKARMKDDVLSREDMESAVRLVEDLGYLALAIVHAGAYIFRSNISIIKYRNQCLEDTRTSLEKYIKLGGSIKHYEKTVYTTWVMSYERLSPCAQRTLGLMAYLHHGGITEEIFKRAASHIDRTPKIPPSDEETTTRKYVRDTLAPFLDADGDWDSNAFSTVMDELVTYSLIGYDRVNEAFTLHVLVQDWSCCTMLPHSKTTALMHTSHLLALSIDLSEALEAITYRRGLLLHVSKVLTQHDVCNINDAEFFARVYYVNGRWKEEEALEVRVVNARKQTLGELHLDTLRGLNSLAETYMNQGRWDEAEALQVQVLDARRQTLGELHPDTLAGMSSLALTYSNQSRWDEAEALQVQVLDARKQIQGELHPDTLTSMNDLASTCRNQGRLDEAEALQVQALNARKQTLGVLHPDTLAIMTNLALAYSNQSRWDEAEVLQVQVLDARKQTRDELHPDTLTSMNDLASTYWNQGRLDEAEALQVQALNARKQTLGVLHPDTLASATNLALTYSNQSRWGEAEALQVEVLKAKKQTLGELHPDTLASMSSLALTYSNQGRLDEAGELRVQVLNAKKQRTVLISRTMPLSEMVAHLENHGCSDITDQLDLASSSTYPLFTGGFGNIYKAHLKTGTEVAVKTIRMRVDHADESTKHLKNAARELHAWAKCDHPNVLKLLGLAQFRDQIGMVSLWMGHGDLRGYLSRHPTADRCQISTKICEGLAYLHRNGIIHGDLKGLNVLVSDTGVPMLTDFGNVTLNDCTLQFTATINSQANLSPRWAAPELLTGTSLYSMQADVYALGMTILETITGKVPYAGKLDCALTYIITIGNELPVRPEDTIPSESRQGDELWALLVSCWSREPKERPRAEAVAKIVSEDSVDTSIKPLDCV